MQSFFSYWGGDVADQHVTDHWVFKKLRVLLKFSLFSSICLPSSVDILLTINLNSLLGKLLISVSLRIFCEVFILLTHLQHIPLCLHVA